MKVFEINHHIQIQLLLCNILHGRWCQTHQIQAYSYTTGVHSLYVFP